MPTKVHKKDIELTLKKADALETIVAKIERRSSKSSKRTEANKFQREAQKYIDAERDVLLIAVKLK